MTDSAEPPGAPSRAAVLTALAALTALALALRLGGLPGPWGTDALSYVESLLGDAPPGGDPRTQRVLFLGMLRLGRATGLPLEIAASLPGVLLSAAVVPALWWAGRPRLGDLGALWPAAVWCVLGIDLEEVVEVSADAALVLPAVLGLGVALRPEMSLRGLALGGAACGLGLALKETFVFPLAGLLLALPVVSPSGERLRRTAVFLVPAVVIGAALGLGLATDRASAVVENLDAAAAPVRWGEPGFWRRAILGPPAILLTATGGFGLLMAAALPLLLRLPIRALRGDGASIAAVGGLLAFAWCPVSLDPVALLPATFPRYVLPVVPAILVAFASTYRTRPLGHGPDLLERIAANLGFLGAFALARGDDPLTWLVPVGAVLAALPITPHVPTSLGWGLAVAAFGILTTTLGWPQVVDHSAAWSPALLVALIVAGGLALLLVRPGRTPPIVRLFPLAVPLVLSIALVRHRFRPELSFQGWDYVPRDGRIVAEPILARRLRVAAEGRPERDPSRVVVWRRGEPLPALDPHDGLLVRDGFAAAARAAREPGLELVPGRVGEALLFRRPGN